MINLFKSFGTVGIVLFVVCLIAFVILFPFAVIWSLNLLFGLSITFTFETWCAVTIIQMFFKDTITVSKK